MIMIQDYYAVVMAGGGGTRFWPRSRRLTPKQLLPITSERTLIQETVARLNRDCPAERTLIITNAALSESTRSQLPEIPQENIIAEPFGRNTAPCIGLAALMAHVRSGEKDPVVGMFAADHDIHPLDAFSHSIRKAVSIAAHGDAIVTIGILPTFPATGYGYIRRGAPLSEDLPGAFTVDAFIEKPAFRTAENFLATGDYLWNAGLFFFRASVTLEEIRRQQPEMFALLEKIRPAIGTPNEAAVLAEAYAEMPSMSFDHAIMEDAQKSCVVESSFLWDDVGSWLALERHLPKSEEGNAVKGDAMFLDSRQCTVDSKRFVALVGVEDLIVVETEDAILICDRHRAEDVRAIVEKLDESGRSDLL